MSGASLDERQRNGSIRQLKLNAYKLTKNPSLTIEQLAEAIKIYKIMKHLDDQINSENPSKGYLV